MKVEELKKKIEEVLGREFFEGKNLGMEENFYCSNCGGLWKECGPSCFVGEILDMLRDA